MLLADLKLRLKHCINKENSFAHESFSTSPINFVTHSPYALISFGQLEHIFINAAFRRFSLSTPVLIIL